MKQVGHLKRQLLSVVVLDHIKWLNVLLPLAIESEKAKHKFPVVLIKADLYLLNHIALVHVLIVQNDTCLLVILEVDLFCQKLKHYFVTSSCHELAVHLWEVQIEFRLNEEICYVIGQDSIDLFDCCHFVDIGIWYVNCYQYCFCVFVAV